MGHDFVVLDLTDPRRPEELSRTPLRRFGRSRQYEESIEELHRQLAPGVLPDSIAQKLEEAGPRLEVFQMSKRTPDGKRFYRIAAPPALGPISLSGDRAYIQRYWPEELAVLDISDLRRPVEVDYVPNESFSSGLTMDGDFAYALRWNGIGAYAVAWYGDLLRRETLGLVEEEEGRRIPGIISAISDTSIISYTDRQIVQVIDIPRRYEMRHAPILAGDYICAILKKPTSSSSRLYRTIECGRQAGKGKKATEFSAVLPQGAVQRVVLRLDLTPGPFPTREGEPWVPPSSQEVYRPGTW